jgi:Exopolysaccharide biosynthesis protein related to N-acetylglucosamine-1-phosphodiester alpha-N-acetylglucosaminidase
MKFRKFLNDPKKFGITYGIVLLLCTTLVLLDTFVIPKALTAAGTTSSSTSSSSDSDSDSSSDTTTASSSTSGSPKVTITTKRINDTTVYIADIQLTDISQLKTAFAQGTYGRNIKETTSETAADNNAIFAINGDYYGFRNSGYVIRNGKLYRDVSSGNTDLAIMSDGTFKFFDESETRAQEILNYGALQVFSFGPVLVEDGEVSVGENAEVSQSMGSNPRTAIGVISPLHYIMVVSDGRTSESAGLTLYQLAQVMQEEGCTEAYNLDGGGSSTMYYDGKVVNNPTSGHGISEREVSDIVCICN